LSSDDSYDDDGRKSESDDDDDDVDDDESGKHGNYSESDEEKYSGNSSGDGSNKSYSENGNSEDDSSVDNSDDDSYDYEKGKDPDDFNDEESSSEGSESVGDPRYVVTETFTDDNEDAQTKKDEFWWEGRETLIAAILLCWCCLCLIIIGVVLGLVFLGGRNKVDTINEIVPVPTERPTFAPQPLPPSQMTQSPTESMQPSFTVTISPTIRPTSRPTVSPTASFLPTKSIPEELGIAADQDTYVQYNVSKEYQGEEYGLLDTLLVQNGPIRDELLPDSVGLITFPLKGVPQFSRMVGRQKSAVLQLTHVVSTEESTEERPLANYTIVRVPETLSAVEYFHGFYFALPEDDDDGVLVGPSFIVNPGDTVINVDISSLLYNYTLDENRKAKQLFLMIENRGPEQIEGGDRFYTRESSTPPQLLLNFVETNDTEVRRF